MEVIDLDLVRKSEYLRKYLWKAICRKTYRENIKSLQLLKEGECIGYLVYDKITIIPHWYFAAKGIIVKPVDNILNTWSLNEIEPITITPDFWTCDCDDHWIHHMTQMSCPVCYTKWYYSTNRNEILKGVTYA